MLVPQLVFFHSFVIASSSEGFRAECETAWHSIHLTEIVETKGKNYCVRE